MLMSGAMLFRERGVEGTAFADVIEHSGAPRGSIYHHFPGGREQFVVEVTETAGGFLSDLIRGVIEKKEASDAIRGFAEIWSAVLKESDFQAGCPIAAVATDGSAPDEAHRAAGSAFGEWQDLITTEVKRNGASAKAARSFAVLVVAAFEGAVMLCRAQRSIEPMTYVTDELCARADELMA